MIFTYKNSFSNFTSRRCYVTRMFMFVHIDPPYNLFSDPQSKSYEKKTNLQEIDAQNTNSTEIANLGNSFLTPYWYSKWAAYMPNTCQQILWYCWWVLISHCSYWIVIWLHRSLHSCNVLKLVKRKFIDSSQTTPGWHHRWNPHTV